MQVHCTVVHRELLEQPTTQIETTHAIEVGKDARVLSDVTTTHDIQLGEGFVVTVRISQLISQRCDFARYRFEEVSALILTILELLEFRRIDPRLETMVAGWAGYRVTPVNLV
ncbi:hypothetical protein D3C76_1389820 [compost metagenome]